MFTALWWVCVNVPEYFNHAVIYMFALIVYVLFSVTRVLPSYGFNTENIMRQVLVGVGASVALALPILMYRVFGATASIAILTLSPVAMFFIVFVAPIVEEMFFRGLMMPVISEWLNNIYVGIVLTAVIFALFHYGVYGVSLNNMMWLIVLAVMLGFITVYSESIVPAIILHMANNAVSVIQYLGYIGYGMYTGLALAVIASLVAYLGYFRVEKIVPLAIFIGIAGIAISAYTIVEPDYSLNLYGELSELALIAITIPVSMLLVTYVADRLGAGITDELLYASIVSTAVLVVLVSYYFGVNIPTIILGVLMGTSIALLIEKR